MHSRQGRVMMEVGAVGRESAQRKMCQKAVSMQTNCPARGRGRRVTPFYREATIIMTACLLPTNRVSVPAWKRNGSGPCRRYNGTLPVDRAPDFCIGLWITIQPYPTLYHRLTFSRPSNRISQRRAYGRPAAVEEPTGWLSDAACLGSGRHRSHLFNLLRDDGRG